MEFLKDIHRQLFENWNFSRENRLVFEEAPEPQPEKKEQEGERPEGEPEGKVQEEIKKIKESIIRLKKESQKLIETYAKEGLTEDEDKTSKYYSGKRVEIYKRMEEFEKKTPELQAAQAIHKEIKELTAEISQHAEKGTTKEFKAETTEEEKEKKAEAPAEKLREGRDKAKAAIEKFIVEKFQGIPAIHIESGEIRELDMATLIKKPTSQTLINTFLNKLPEDRIKEVEKNPNLTPTKDEVKFFREAFCKITGIEEISDSDPKEMEAVKKLIGDKLPAQGGSLAEILSRTHNIVEEDGQLTINGDAVKDVAGLKPYLPANIQATFDAAIKKNPEDKTLANLEQIAKRNVDGLAGFQKMLDSMGESKEGGKKMGAIEGLMALLQLLPTIMEALKKGDFTIVNEMMADFNKGENPAKNVSESKKGYDKILKDKSPDLKTLLSVYEDPSTNNQAANDLFCEGKTEEEIKTDPLGKYRLMAKPAIQAQLAQKLGLRISKMESDDMGTKVEGMAR
ncbi:hypothetical protein JW752_03095, partial [Candidatus Peregrinibacteria bacterium]|nr:hypothetical protein [Candidatus Peregrinibacteria bacterium]